MRLVPPPLEIGERDGFTGTDLFGYEPFGTDLARLVESLEGPSVIALDGGWGSGKTVFARQWAGLLRKRGSAVIYFDAFAADTGDDPLFDIASQLFAAAPEGEKRDQFVRAAVALGTRLVPLVTGIGLRAMTAGLIGPEEVREGAAALTDARKAGNNTGPEVSEAFRGRIEGADDRAVALADFRSCLTALAATLRKVAIQSVEGSCEISKPRPAVVIIDELDRCKPTYALDLLENIKHLFDADNLCFVLVTNLDQLGKVVSRKYGLEIEANKYLEKFVHARFHLPDAVGPMREQNAERYRDHLWKKAVPESHGMPHGAAAVIAETARHHKWSLRCIEQVMRNVGVCATVSGIPQDDTEILVAIVCSVQVLDPELYSRMRTEMASADAVLACIGGSPQLSARYGDDGLPEICRTVFPPTEVVEGGNPEADARWRDSRHMPRFSRVSVPSMCRILDSFGQHVR